MFLEESGNYLIHRDILRHQISQKQGTFQLKQEVKFEVVVVNHGNKKVQVVLVLVQTVLHYGKVVVLFLVQNQEKLLKIK